MSSRSCRESWRRRPCSRCSTTGSSAIRGLPCTPTTAATTSCSTPVRGTSSPATRSTRCTDRRRFIPSTSSDSRAVDWPPAASSASTWRRWQTVFERHSLRPDLATSALHHPAQIAALIQLDPVGCSSVGRGSPSTDLHPRLEFLAPAAYEPGLWRANARTLVESYTSPLGRISNLPPPIASQLPRLIAGKRLLLFSLLERSDGDLERARDWLAQARQIAGDDPEIVLYGRQLAAEIDRGAP